MSLPAGAHLSAFRTPSPEGKAAQTMFQTPLSTGNTCPSSVSSISRPAWSCPWGTECPLWRRRWEVWQCQTFPSSNPQMGCLSVADGQQETWLKRYVYSQTCTVSIYTGAGAGSVPLHWRADGGGPATRSLHCISLFDRLVQCSVLNVQYFVFFVVFLNFSNIFPKNVNLTPQKLRLRSHETVLLICNVLRYINIVQ